MQADEARELARTIAKEYQEEMQYDDRLCQLEGIIEQRVKPLLAHHALEARFTLLRELAAEECPACKDGAELFRDEESGQWAHERSGLPNFLCEAPEIVAERICSLAERASKGAAGGVK